MKTKILSLAVLVMAGCVPSWNPFYTGKDLVFDAALVGTWRPVAAKETSKELWTFHQDGDRLYKLQQTDEEGRKATFAARLFQLNGQRYVDLHLTNLDGDDLKVNAWAGISLVPAHLLLKVEQLEPALKLAAMNPDWMRKFLKKSPEAIAHQVVGDGDIVLTADTVALQKFVLSHFNDPDFFGNAMEMKRQ